MRVGAAITEASDETRVIAGDFDVFDRRGIWALLAGELPIEVVTYKGDCGN